MASSGLQARGTAIVKHPQAVHLHRQYIHGGGTSTLLCGARALLPCHISCVSFIVCPLPHLTSPHNLAHLLGSFAAAILMTEIFFSVCSTPCRRLRRWVWDSGLRAPCESGGWNYVERTQRMTAGKGSPIRHARMHAWPWGMAWPYPSRPGACMRGGHGWGWACISGGHDRRVIQSLMYDAS